jgi:hypothetical protein
MLFSSDRPPKGLNNLPCPLYKFPLKSPLNIVFLSFLVNFPFPSRTTLFNFNVASPSYMSPFLKCLIIKGESSLKLFDLEWLL